MSGDERTCAHFVRIVNTVRIKSSEDQLEGSSLLSEFISEHPPHSVSSADSKGRPALSFKFFNTRGRRHTNDLPSESAGVS
jgi:hypothetical protein